MEIYFFILYMEIYTDFFFNIQSQVGLKVRRFYAGVGRNSLMCLCYALTGPSPWMGILGYPTIHSPWGTEPGQQMLLFSIILTFLAFKTDQENFHFGTTTL